MFVNSPRSASRFIAVSSLEFLACLAAQIAREHTSAVVSASPVSCSTDAKQGNRPPLMEPMTDYTRAFYSGVTTIIASLLSYGVTSLSKSVGTGLLS